jgi:HlyD family secretion protein
VMWESDAVLQVPSSTVFRDGDGWAVYRIEGDVAVRRAVELGQRAPRAVQVLDGVDEGDQLVAYPPDTLTDGARVAPEGA